MSAKLVAYYRVSTVRQGKSGLGLDAQREAVSIYLGCRNADIIEAFTEIESGRRDDRPQLARALAMCRVHRAKLVIAKLDRLARNVAFVSNLMKSGIEFEACDYPQANRLTIHILAAVAEHEAHMASERTKAALAAAKARGVRLGGFRGRVASDDDRRKGHATRSRDASDFARDLSATVEEIKVAGAFGSSALARALNDRGLLTPRGMSWSSSQAGRLIARISSLDLNQALRR